MKMFKKTMTAVIFMLHGKKYYYFMKEKIINAYAKITEIYYKILEK